MKNSLQEDGLQKMGQARKPELSNTLICCIFSGKQRGDPFWEISRLGLN